jgi:uncharacterized protein involved in cysteine biosynthesis
MLQSKIPEWLYYLSCVSAAVAIVYLALWFGGLMPRLIGRLSAKVVEKDESATLRKVMNILLIFA